MPSISSDLEKTLLRGFGGGGKQFVSGTFRFRQLMSPEEPKKKRTIGFAPWKEKRGYRNPNIYTIHVTPNHSHKASFELRDDVAVFRQVGTHKELDRAP